MLSTTVAAILGFVGVVSAIPAAVSPTSVSSAAISPTAAPLPANIKAIMAVDPASFQSYQTGGLIRENSTVTTTTHGLLAAAACQYGTNSYGACCSTSAKYTTGDHDGGGWGVTIENGSPSLWEGFYFYENSCDSVPIKYTWIAPGSKVFITLASNFQGRMTRGTDAMNLVGRPNLLGTWFEFNWQPDGIWGDISLIRGCDQGMLMWSTDGSGAWKGFTQDILANAPVGAWAQKPDGNWCLAPTEGPTADKITANYELGAVGAQYAYIDDAHGNPVIHSSNGRFGVYADPGLI